MPKPTVISRRVADCIKEMELNNTEGALLNLFPAIDVTAKRRYPKEKKVGVRFKKFLNDQEVFIYFTATGASIKNVTAGGLSLADALYKFGRTSMMHDGELENRISFDAQDASMGKQWFLTKGFIAGMIISVAIAEENKDEFIEPTGSFNVFGGEYTLNELWGREKHFEKIIAELCNG